MKCAYCSEEIEENDVVTLDATCFGNLMYNEGIADYVNNQNETIQKSQEQRLDYGQEKFELMIGVIKNLVEKYCPEMLNWSPLSDIFHCPKHQPECTGNNVTEAQPVNPIDPAIE